MFVKLHDVVAQCNCKTRIILRFTTLPNIVVHVLTFYSPIKPAKGSGLELVRAAVFVSSATEPAEKLLLIELLLNIDEPVWLFIIVD